MSRSGNSVERGTDEFTAKVSEFFAGQFAGFGGRARVIVDDSKHEIEVHWTKEANWQDPKQKVLDLLNDGKLKTALPMLWTLVQNNPSDTDNLYHLGVVYSELREFDKASATLEQLVELAPLCSRARRLWGLRRSTRATCSLPKSGFGRRLRSTQKTNGLLRNSCACLMKQNRYEEEKPRLESLSLAEVPDDIAAPWLDLARPRSAW